MSEDENPFAIPEALVEKIFDISGDSDKYKGVIMIVANESGEPVIFSKFDSVMTELGLRKSLEEYLRKVDNEAGGNS